MVLTGNCALLKKKTVCVRVTKRASQGPLGPEEVFSVYWWVCLQSEWI